MRHPSAKADRSSANAKAGYPLVDGVRLTILVEAWYFIAFCARIEHVPARDDGTSSLCSHLLRSSAPCHSLERLQLLYGLPAEFYEESVRRFRS